MLSLGMKQIKTAAGIINILASNGKIMLCDWESSKKLEKHKGILNGYPIDSITEANAAEYLELFFSGSGMKFFTAGPSVIPINPIGTQFQKKVWSELMKIPYGHTVSYSELAERVGSHPRAVACAVANNPVSIFIPCHRIVGLDGNLRGYAGGLQAKKILLEIEGISFKGEYLRECS